MPRTRRRTRVLTALVTAAAVVAVAAALVFEPWKLVINQRVDEAAPTASVAAAPVAAPGPDVPPLPPPAPVRLVSGMLISHEHASSGTATVLRLPDGSRVLRLENLHTSNGPRLKVWLSDAPVLPGAEGWYVFDDGRHVDLGDLKGNIGSANYPIPADTDLTVLTSVSIWCDRFDVSFAAAALS